MLLPCAGVRPELWVVTPYYERGSLHSLLYKETATFGDVLSILADAAEGLGELHKRGWVHRDFKAPNILVTSEGRGVLSDADMCVGLGQTHKFYPEHDLFSVGATLLQVLTCTEDKDYNKLQQAVQQVAATLQHDGSVRVYDDYSRTAFEAYKVCVCVRARARVCVCVGVGVDAWGCV